MISVKLNHFSNILSMYNDCRILFPDEVKEDETLKVLWLCHGGSGDENEWMYYSTVASISDSRHLAVVIVNANDSCFADMAYGLNYRTYLGKELPELLVQMFPHLSDKREDNYICGLSNGGYGCMLIGLSFPSRFGAIGAFSAGDKADSAYKPAEPGEITPRIRMIGADEFHNSSYSIRYLLQKVPPKARKSHESIMPAAVRIHGLIRTFWSDKQPKSSMTLPFIISMIRSKDLAMNGASGRKNSADF
ncbi:MAG: hypothetical protein IKG37_11695 [Solobacterium sp.]|nr:hypothetical protein [Solobacterium sp.]